MANLFYKATHLRGYIFAKEGYISVLQVKIKFRSKFFKLGLILYFLSLPALVIHELGLETKETKNQPRLKNFNLNLILTYNIIIHNYQSYIVITLII